MGKTEIRGELESGARQIVEEGSGQSRKEELSRIVRGGMAEEQSRRR